MRIAVCDDCAEDAQALQGYLAGHELSVYSDADSGFFMLDVMVKIRQPE